MRILLLLVVLPLAWAQFPAVCNTQDNLDTKRCCPNNCGGSTRGTCASIRESVESSWSSANQDIFRITNSMQGWPQDVRHQWPIRVFEMVCRCNPGWGSYDCSRCDFGYIDNGAGECEKQTNPNQLLVRRNFMELSNQERSDYIRVLQEAKNEEEKEWAVVAVEPNDTSGSFTLQNVSTYDMFVVQHFLAAREKDNDDCKETLNSEGVAIDFAHEGSAFLTWHRYFLLIVERELRRVAEKIGVSGFTVAYWDWTPMDTNLFTQELFGTPRYSDSQVNVIGNLFENMWPVVCDQHYSFGSVDNCRSVRDLCNISSDRNENRRLQRGHMISGTDAFLPTVNSILMALAAGEHTDSNINYSSDTGFNRRLEGFVGLCAEQTTGKCFFTKDGVHNNLHNAVHIYLGGHMRVVPAASNDPIFFLHHANIDRIFEAWLRKFSGNIPPYKPMSGGHPGHNRNDSLVPFFPLKTNADMYKVSSELGYQYDTTTWDIPGSDFPRCTNTECERGSTDTPTPSTGGGGGGTTSAPSTGGGGGGTTSTPGTRGGGGGTTTQSAGSSDFRVPVRTLLITGTCALLIVLKLFI